MIALCRIVRNRSQFWKIGLGCLLSLSLAGQSIGIGPVEVVSTGLNEFEIRRGETVWRVDLSRLIRANDCAWAGPPICTGRPTAPCPECPRAFELIAWDEHHQRLYFSLTTGNSKNNPRTIFNYNLTTRRVSRFINTWSATLEKGTVSRSGRYLAYVNNGHAGFCANFAGIEIVDLWNRRLASPMIPSANSDDVVTIERVHWLSDFSLDYEGNAYRQSDCYKDAGPQEHPSPAVSRFPRWSFVSL